MKEERKMRCLQTVAAVALLLAGLLLATFPVRIQAQPEPQTVTIPVSGMT